MTKTVGMFLLLLTMVSLSACTSQEELAKEQLRELARQTESQLQRLGQHIEQGHIANAKKLSLYAKMVKSSTQDPEISVLVDELALDGTTKGPIYQGLVHRLKDANADLKTVKGKKAIDELLQEFSALSEASRMDNFGWMLTDTINVLADMSNGRLARVEAMSKEASLRANGANDYGAGSQLVGNPNYGHWQTSSSGQSLWAWYGQYALFSTLFHRPIYYGGWAQHRDYSYYHSAGRYQYTSRSQRKAQDTVQKTTQKKFRQSGKSFSSPYAKTKKGSARASAQASKASNSFKSSYARSSSKKSKNSFGSVNSRNSSSRNSRSYSRRGK